MNNNLKNMVIYDKDKKVIGTVKEKVFNGYNKSFNKEKNNQKVLKMTKKY